jgi:hypothetical protein
MLPNKPLLRYAHEEFSCLMHATEIMCSCQHQATEEARAARSALKAAQEQLERERESSQQVLSDCQRELALTQRELSQTARRLLTTERQRQEQLNEHEKRQQLQTEEHEEKMKVSEEGWRRSLNELEKQRKELEAKAASADEYAQRLFATIALQQESLREYQLDAEARAAELKLVESERDEEQQRAEAAEKKANLNPTP